MFSLVFLLYLNNVLANIDNWIIVDIQVFVYCFSFSYYNLQEKIHVWSINRCVCDVICDIVNYRFFFLVKNCFKLWLHLEANDIHGFALFNSFSILFMCNNIVSVLKWVSQLTKDCRKPYLHFFQCTYISFIAH